jgi:outer membrane protein
MKRLPFVVFLLIAMPAGAEDLLEVYRQAQQNDPVFGAARAAHQANIEKAPQGRALLLPSVTLNASTTQTDQDVTITTPNSYNYRADSYGLTLTQPLYRKQNFAGAEQGARGAEQAGHDLVTARHDLIQRTAHTYLGVLAAEDALEFAQAEKNAIERLAALVQRNFSVGTASLVDVHDTQAALDLAVAQEIAARNDLEVRREGLRVLTGALPASLARLATKLPVEHPDPDNMEKWVEIAQAQNPQIKSSEQAYEIAVQELEKNRGGHHPTLDLSAAHLYSDAGGSQQGFAIESTTNQVGLIFQMPLYAGGAVSSKVRESYARREEASQRLDQARRTVAQRTRESYLAVLNGRARVLALEQALASNQRALETTLLGYERGLRNGPDVLASQRVLFRTRRDLSQARYDTLLSRLRLKAAAGTLADDDLGEINRQLAYR